jgi:hypothetical protein
MVVLGIVSSKVFSFTPTKRHLASGCMISNQNQSKAISAATDSPLDIQPSALADMPMLSLDSALEAPSPSSQPETASRHTPLPAGSPLDMPFTEMSAIKFNFTQKAWTQEWSR